MARSSQLRAYEVNTPREQEDEMFRTSATLESTFAQAALKGFSSRVVYE